MAKYRNWGIASILAAMLVLVVRGDLVITGAELSGHVPGTPPSSSSLNTSLVSYWKMDESSGTRYDSEPTGTAQDLQDNATVGYTNGIIGNAAYFISANSESLTIPDSADLSTGDISFSIAAWFKLDGVLNNQAIAARYGSSQEYLLRFQGAAKQVQFYVVSGGSVNILATNVLSTNTWYFTVAVYNATNNTMYVSVDNKTQSTGTNTGPSDTTVEFSVGMRNSTDYFGGAIDEVGFWKRVLTSDEIAELYNSGSGKTCCPF